MTQSAKRGIIATIKESDSGYQLQVESMNMGQAKRLSSMQPTEKAIISGFASGCDYQYRQQLLSMGVVPNTVIELLRVAPLGDPMAFSVRGARLILRKSEADQVFIEAVV